MIKNIAPHDNPLLNIHATCAYLSKSRATIYNMMSAQSAFFDPMFPKPIRLGSSPKGSIRWVKSELDEYIAQKISERNQKIAEVLA